MASGSLADDASDLASHSFDFTEPSCYVLVLCRTITRLEIRQMQTAFIDSNIYNRVATQGVPGCEESFFDELFEMVSDQTLRLLVPEVVTLEVEKFSKITFPNKLASEVDQIHNKLKSLDGWNELSAMREEITKSINTIRESRLDIVKKRFDKIALIIDSDNVVKLPLSADVLLACQRATLAGRMPSNEKVGGDALLIETLVQYFSTGDKPDEFHFCSENHSHFAQEVQAGQKKKRAFRLHDKLQSRLPKSIYSTSLAELIGFCKKTTSPPPPESKPVPSTSYHSVGGVPYEIEYVPSGVSVTLPIETQFHPAFTTSSPSGTLQPSQAFLAGLSGAAFPMYPWWFQRPSTMFGQAGTFFINEIVPLLEACRRTGSWNAESERELPNWLEGVPENQLGNASIETLLTVYDNLKRYLAQHQELDRANRKRAE
jgi:hypothetical protein